MLGGVKPLPVEDLEHVLRHTAPLWERTRGRRIFLAGGTGFFGAWLVESFAHCNRALGLGARMMVLSRAPERFLERMPHLKGESALEFAQGDVRTFAFPEGGFDFVVHGATSTSLDAARRPEELRSVLVDGTARMIAFARQCGAKAFLLTSSGAVYGRQPVEVAEIPEEYDDGPVWNNADDVYAEGKRASERMCAEFARETGVQCVLARCFAFVGPHLPLNQHFAIGNFIGDALAGRDIVVKGDGRPARSYLYAADLAVWLWTMLLRAAETPGNPAVYNVGSAKAVSIGALAETVRDELNPRIEVRIEGDGSIGVSRSRYVPDVRKAEKELGLRAWIELSEAIRRTAAWHG